MSNNFEKIAAAASFEVELDVAWIADPNAQHAVRMVEHDESFYALLVADAEGTGDEVVKGTAVLTGLPVEVQVAVIDAMLRS